MFASQSKCSPFLFQSVNTFYLHFTPFDLHSRLESLDVLQWLCRTNRFPDEFHEFQPLICLTSFQHSARKFNWFVCSYFPYSHFTVCNLSVFLPFLLFRVPQPFSWTFLCLKTMNLHWSLSKAVCISDNISETSWYFIIDKSCWSCFR